MLPEAIAICYRRYKAYESTILHWVISTSNECGYKKTTVPKQRKTQHTEPDLTETPESNSPEKPVQYVVPLREIVPRVESIVSCGRRVPPFVTNYLKSSIADREKCTAWFKRHRVGDIVIERSTEDHIRFTNTLKDVLAMLEPNLSTSLGPPNLILPRAVLDTNLITEGRHRFSNLQVEEPQGIEETADVTELTPEQTSDDSAPPQADVKDVYEAESTDEDRLIAVYELLDKLRKVQKCSGETWNYYRQRQISLVNATAVTNAAIELVQTWEDKFTLDFPESPVWGELIDVLFPEITRHWRTEAEAWSEQDIEDLESIHFFTTHMLKDFLNVYLSPQSDFIKIWQPKINQVYDPRQDASNIESSREMLRRNRILLDNVFPELALQAEHTVVYTRDKITGAFKDMLQTKKVRLSTAFSVQLLCDIHILLDDQMLRPLYELKTQMRRFDNANDKRMHPMAEKYDFFKQYADAHQSLCSIASTYLDPTAMSIWRGLHFHDIDNHKYEGEAHKLYFLVTHQTLMCGSMTAAVCFRMQEFSTRLADDWFDVTAVLHLYNALKQESCLSGPVPFLTALSKLYGSVKVFFGAEPTNPQAYKNHYLLALGFSLQNFASGKLRKGFVKRKEASKTRTRDLTVLPPIIHALNLELNYSEAPVSALPTLIKLVEAQTKPRRSSLPKPQSSSHRGKNPELDPIAFLSSLRECLTEEQPRLDADYYLIHDICNRLLRRIESSQLVHKKFRKAFELGKNDPVDGKLYYVPLFIFDQHLDNDPKESMWLRSVGETVEKFFREEGVGAEEMLRTGLVECEERADKVKDFGDFMGGDYWGDVPEEGGQGRWVIDEKWHPTLENGRCCHVGVCEVIAKKWRRRAGLEEESDVSEGDEQGEEEVVCCKGGE